MFIYCTKTKRTVLTCAAFVYFWVISLDSKVYYASFRSKHPQKTAHHTIQSDFFFKIMSLTYNGVARTIRKANDLNTNFTLNHNVDDFLFFHVTRDPMYKVKLKMQLSPNFSAGFSFLEKKSGESIVGTYDLLFEKSLKESLAKWMEMFLKKFQYDSSEKFLGFICTL